jgi:hypothetical protein
MNLPVHLIIIVPCYLAKVIIWSQQCRHFIINHFLNKNNMTRRMLCKENVCCREGVFVNAIVQDFIQELQSTAVFSLSE